MLPKLQVNPELRNIFMFGSKIFQFSHVQFSVVPQNKLEIKKYIFVINILTSLYNKIYCLWNMFKYLQKTKKMKNVGTIKKIIKSNHKQ